MRQPEVGARRRAQRLRRRMKRGPEWKGCTSKRSHVTIEEARKHALEIEQRYGGEGVVYSCRWCSSYHVSRRKQEKETP